MFHCSERSSCRFSFLSWINASNSVVPTVKWQHCRNVQEMGLLPTNSVRYANTAAKLCSHWPSRAARLSSVIPLHIHYSTSVMTNYFWSLVLLHRYRPPSKETTTWAPPVAIISLGCHAPVEKFNLPFSDSPKHFPRKRRIAAAPPSCLN